jgi:hypothetical protein
MGCRSSSASTSTQEQEKARMEGREPPERLDKPASFYLNNESLSSE